MCSYRRAPHLDAFSACGCVCPVAVVEEFLGFDRLRMVAEHRADDVYFPVSPGSGTAHAWWLAAVIMHREYRILEQLDPNRTRIVD